MGRKQIPAHEKLANALRALQAVTEGGGRVRYVVRGRELKASDRRMLQDYGHLREILKGWYFVSDPNAAPGDTTLFFANFWEYLGLYLADRFQTNYCLNPEHSLLRHVQYNRVPNQVQVLNNRALTQYAELKFGHTLAIYPGTVPDGAFAQDVYGVRCMSLPMALVRCMPQVYKGFPDEVATGLRMLDDPGQIVPLIEISASGVGRVVGGLRALGRTALADQIERILVAQGHALGKVSNPFEIPVAQLGERPLPPMYARVRSLWEKHAPAVRGLAPQLPAQPPSPPEYAGNLEAVKVLDAYHSLSIERYRVTPELIARVASGQWSPAQNPQDKQQVDAMAAKGYLEAFNLISAQAVDAYAQRDNPDFNAGRLFVSEHRIWFSTLFSPSVRANIIPAEAVAGYRRHMVYLTGSNHAPPHYDHVAAGMLALGECLQEEPCAFTRAVLGHWLFGFVHPYMDGNGRMARFTMNVMLASGGYPWAVVRVESRAAYMAALEKASVEGDVQPFAQFIAETMARQNRAVGLPGG